MTDLHTHILPGIDDGARTVEISLDLLRMERDQGVDTVVLTPHFYRDRENISRFLSRRATAVETLKTALAALPEQESKTLPRMVVGVEVAWVPGLAELPELFQLTFGPERALLLELPFYPWNEQMFHDIYDMMDRRGVLPIIAHIERYWKIQKAEHIENILSLGVPIQISAEPLLHTLGGRRARKLLQEGAAHLVASDCHNTTSRLPNLGPAMAVIRRKLGEDRASKIERAGDRLVSL